jgi:predicted amidophosphoribosyltransferase
MRTGALRRAIDRYKVDGKIAWARIFARVLLGYLDAHPRVFERYELIVPSPTFVGAGGRAFDHTAEVIEWAQVEDVNEWPFATGVIEKVRSTTAFRGRTWQQRREIAETELRQALVVPKPKIVAGNRVLVYDDVYTEGLTLREVARAVRAAGAVEVSEVVLARQPYGG